MQYIGKDVITQGSLLHLDPAKAWNLLRSRAKQGIRKAEKAGVRVTESRDLALMARVWYNPDTLTPTLDDHQKLYLAYLDDELIGGIIVTPVSPNTLFYHYGGTNALGRSVEANAYLLWHIVKTFHGSAYEYLDVGVSFRPELQHYFQKYCTQSYPILFHPPPEDVRPKIGLNPFSTSDLDWVEQQQVAINTQLFEYFEAEFTYLPSWAFALQSALRALALPPNAVIGTWASVGEKSYIAQLGALFGDRYRFAPRESSAPAFLVCHRWGIPCAETEALATTNTPLIEDCRDVLYARESATGLGSFGRFAVFDFARWFPMPYGAALVGEFFPDRAVWDDFHCLDVTKRNVVRELLQIHWPQRGEYARRRFLNWHRYRDLFALIGFKPVEPDPTMPPVAFLLQTVEPYGADVTSERLARFGIAIEMDERSQIAAVPCHEGLGRGHLDYVFGAFRGMVNPCHRFVRTDPSLETP